MKIGFDISLSLGEKTGCGFFTNQLISSLMQIDKVNKYTLYPLFYEVTPSYKKCLILKNIKLPPNFNMHFKCFNPFSFLYTKLNWLFFKESNKRSIWLKSPDIIHSNSFSCFNEKNAKVVYTLYDVVPLSCSQTVDEATWVACSRGLFYASLYADFCIAISEYTKKSFLKYFPYYPEERIQVIPLGVRHQIQRVSSQEVIDSVLRKYNIPKKFWFSSGTVEPRKNYGFLIDAYSKTDRSFPLIIAGAKGWKQSMLPEKIKKLKLKDKVCFLGYITDEELSALYSSCTAFIYPSLYEGFGLPILEAMHCGAPVICSDVTSMPEVGGNAVLYINPHSIETLIGAMTQLSQNELMRDSFGKAGLERSKLFTWENAASSVLNIYDKVLKMPFYNGNKHG